MNLQQRIDILVDLGAYMLSDEPGWMLAQQKAYAQNNWFTPEFTELAIRQITAEFLDRSKLEAWTKKYAVPQENKRPLNFGIVMAGNIPLVGFHDFLSVFISGHRQTIKPSSRDQVLITQLLDQVFKLDPEARNLLSIADTLKGCDAYIATGSNNSARYFEYYFSKYPHIIRHNRTSVALLTGRENREELEKLADDVYQYFGLGCRNITQIHVPHGYDFAPLLNAFSKYNYLSDHHKYKNNYDYRLALLILNKKYYMTNGSVLLTEDPSPFSAISVLHYQFYDDPGQLYKQLAADEGIQCIVGRGFIPFGQAQKPGLTDYADGADSMAFLLRQ